ncbi:hypothetical protein BC937DRAFT_93071 [Endogone sp. FLAS-F59071]|nr:hypothetical protein BC937DRAFT_93071 [Endogone sp. FLAS-F59071]|eukprot:RUS14973.1 hypothetical protein BC937DRAFT_93071 [Endogone sp. FLAS-F59071]
MASIWEDLENWQHDIKQKDLQLLKKKPLVAQRWTHAIPLQKLDPPRPTAEIVLNDEVLPKNTSTMDSGKRTERIASSDYRAWNKFDVDKAVQDLDNPPEQPQSNTKITTGGSPPTVIKGTPKKSLTPTKVPEVKAKPSTPARKKEEVKDKDENN